MPNQVHEVGGVFAVVNRKGRIQADLFGVFAQQPGADAVVALGRCGRSWFQVRSYAGPNLVDAHASAAP
jgi:hypothetical protein